MRSERDGALPPRRAGRAADPALRALWCAAIGRVNQAESYGSRLELERVFATGAADADPIELHVLLQERIHARILKEVARSCGAPVEEGAPPRLMRWLIHRMQRLPDSLRYVLILCGEALGCVVFGGLRDAADRCLEPELAERCRSLLDEIVADETLHARYCRARLAPAGIHAARGLAPLVARGFVHDVPELHALGLGHRELTAQLQRGIEIPQA